MTLTNLSISPDIFSASLYVSIQCYQHHDSEMQPEHNIRLSCDQVWVHSRENLIVEPTVSGTVHSRSLPRTIASQLGRSARQTVRLWINSSVVVRLYDISLVYN